MLSLSYGKKNYQLLWHACIRPYLMVYFCCPAMKDVLGQAIEDHFEHNAPGKLWIHNTYGRKEEMPVNIYFRKESQMPALELKALEQCKGKVMDIGAGAGAHALALQAKGIDVSAMDISEKAVAVMKKRGVKQVMRADIMQVTGALFDTLLLLMNGIGLTSNLQGLRLFLQKARTLLKPGGQLLFDSSDVAYLYKDGTQKLKNYYGEVPFQYEYKGQKSDWFTWLYIDQKTLIDVATREGWQVTILFVDDYEQYLARLQPLT